MSKLKKKPKQQKQKKIKNRVFCMLVLCKDFQEGLIVTQILMTTVLQLNSSLTSNFEKWSTVTEIFLCMGKLPLFCKDTQEAYLAMHWLKFRTFWTPQQIIQGRCYSEIVFFHEGRFLWAGVGKRVHDFTLGVK